MLVFLCKGFWKTNTWRTKISASYKILETRHHNLLPPPCAWSIRQTYLNVNLWYGIKRLITHCQSHICINITVVCLLCECVRQLYAEHEVPSNCAHRNPASSLASTLARAIYLWDPASSVIQNAKLVLTLKLRMDTKDAQFFGLEAPDV